MLLEWGREGLERLLKWYSHQLLPLRQLYDPSAATIPISLSDASYPILATSCRFGGLRVLLRTFRFSASPCVALIAIRNEEAAFSGRQFNLSRREWRTTKCMKVDGKVNNRHIMT